MPCGQKNRVKETSHSHTVTPPLAAMDGTTLRLKTATTKSKTRSQRPRTRFRLGACSAPPPATAAIGAALVISEDKCVAPLSGCEAVLLKKFSGGALGDTQRRRNKSAANGESK